MVSKIGILGLLSPRRFSLPGAPLPSSGSLGVVPRPHRYYWGAPTSHRPHSPRFSRSSSSACSPYSLSLGTASAPASLGFGRRLPSRFHRRRRWDLPGRWGILVSVPCCLTPVGRPQPRFAAWTKQPTDSPNIVGPTLAPFEAQSHSPLTRCLRFVLGLPRPTQDSLPACWLGFDWSGLSPAGSLR